MSGKVLSSWIEFFGGFASDNFGPVSVDRALASMDYQAYYGELSDIAVWKNYPVTLKVPNRLETIVPHTFVEYMSNTVWPKDACVYNLDPQNLNAYLIGAGIPAAMAMPLTAAMTNSPQIDTYCRRVNSVAITILLCDPPVIVFRRHQGGLNGPTISQALIALERVIVRGFLECSKIPDTTCFTVLPNHDYSPEKLSVKFEFSQSPYLDRCQRYMSMTGKERARYIPTSRVQDVYIGGDKIGMEEDKMFIPNYPRQFPTVLPTSLRIRGTYTDKGEYVEDTNFSPTSWSAKQKAEAPPPTSAPRAAPYPDPEEGEIPEHPAPPAGGNPEPVPAPAPEPASSKPADPPVGTAYKEAEKRAETVPERVIPETPAKAMETEVPDTIKVKALYLSNGKLSTAYMLYNEKTKKYYRMNGTEYKGNVTKHTIA